MDMDGLKRSGEFDMDCLNVEIAQHLCRRGAFKSCELFAKVGAAHQWSVYHHSDMNYFSRTYLSKCGFAILGRWHRVTRGIVGTTQRRICGLEGTTI